MTHELTVVLNGTDTNQQIEFYKRENLELVDGENLVQIYHNSGTSTIRTFIQAYDADDVDEIYWE